MDVLVIGSGPAGSAVAVGLRKLGYGVRVLTAPRGFSSIEGISERTLQALQDLGLRKAASGAEGAVQRVATWGGSSRPANSEFLLDRDCFDAGLVEDLTAHDIEVIDARVTEIDRSTVTPALWTDKDQVFKADFVVDARGRAAHFRSNASISGPATLALSQMWQSSQPDAQSQVLSIRDGWLWMSRLTGGRSIVQWVLNAHQASIPKRKDLSSWVRDQLACVPEAENFISDAKFSTEVVARAATSRLQKNIVSDNYICVGDVAMAVDPLSGNGIFQALSSAALAPAVINTIICRPVEAQTAKNFFNLRVEETFLRYSRTGRDFYLQCAENHPDDFWIQRAVWPDDIAVHSSSGLEFYMVEKRAVVEKGFISSRKVALTSDREFGVWQVAGVDVGELLDNLPANKDERKQIISKRIAHCSQHDEQSLSILRQWLRRYQLL